MLGIERDRGRRTEWYIERDRDRGKGKIKERKKKWEMDRQTTETYKETEI